MTVTHSFEFDDDELAAIAGFMHARGHATDPDVRRWIKAVMKLALRVATVQRTMPPDASEILATGLRALGIDTASPTEAAANMQREQLKAARAALIHLREFLPEFGSMDGRVWSAIDAGLAHSGDDG